MKSEASLWQRYPHLIYWLGGAGVYMASLIVTAPAGLLEWMLPGLSKDRIFLEQAEGGLWHGQARHLKVKTFDGKFISMGSVHWDVLALSLLKLELSAKIELENGQNSSTGIISAGFGKFHLRQLKATLPVSLLSELDSAWRTWKPNGLLKLSTNNITIGRQGVSGKAELEWRNASLSLSEVNPLGDYRLDIQGKPQGAQFSVSTLSGVLHLAGKGDWSVEKGLSFQGAAQGEPSKKEALRDLLVLLGSEQGNGVYPIAFSNVKLRK